MPRPVSVLLVRSSGATPEGEAALAWLRSLPGMEPEALPIERLPDEIGDGTSIVWFHLTEPPEAEAAVRAALDAHVRAGGGLLATLAAAVLPHRLGWERIPPNEITAGAWADEPEDLAFAGSLSVVPRVRGLQSFRGHPLFDGLGGGCYTWDPQEGEPFVRYAYVDDTWPESARVVAVQRSYIAVDARRRLAWEYMLADGWVICIGGFAQLAARDPAHRPHLERLLRNALQRVRPEERQARLLGGAWTPPAVGVEPSSGAALPPKLPAGREPVLRLDGGDIRLERAATDEAYTLAGARALLVGGERGGPQELWFHPVRAMSSWKLMGPGGGAGGGAEAGSGDVLAGHCTVTPGIIERRLTGAGRRIVERSTVALDEPAALIELWADDDGGGAIELDWNMETDMRLMWPYPAWASGRLQYQVDDGAIGVMSDAGEWLGVRVEPSAPIHVEDISDGGPSRLRIRARLSIADPVRILLLGAGRAERPPLSVSPADWRTRLLRVREAQRAPRVAAPRGDRQLDEAVEWAKWRLSTFRVKVPGLGTSLVAGYDASRACPFHDGRPGYAWYFARDAAWSALAALAAGQARIAKEVLLFLGKHQDITGKILHECTTSGVIHYDAADSTPLYLLLAARYAAATGDDGTLRDEWSRIVNAYEFCLTTDSDGDGLIENTRVGHGWVEFGPLGRNHVSLYLAGVWVAALTELEPIARRIGDPALSEELAYRAGAARAALELAFFDPLEGRYATGLHADGSRNMAESVMTAVPLLLGAIRPERCARWLDRVASEAFTTPWGVRIMPADAPDYDPEGYHTGAIWPLFTGWVALAEARAGRREAARSHWEQVARLYREYELGAFPEVLLGDEPRRVGVTPDQAWSAAMVLLPLAALADNVIAGREPAAGA